LNLFHGAPPVKDSGWSLQSPRRTFSQVDAEIRRFCGRDVTEVKDERKL